MLYGREYSSWKNWDGGFGEISSADYIYYHAELKRLKIEKLSNINIFEIGFGSGKFFSYCKSEKINISGSEVNQSLLDSAIEKNFNVTDSSGLKKISDSTFDAIVAFDVVEHLEHDEMCNLLSEGVRIAKPGGKILLRFPNGDSPLSMQNQNGDITHKSIIGTGIIKYYAKILKLEIDYIGPPSQPISIMIPLASIHRILVFPIKFIINSIVNIIFFPKEKIYFSSSNLLVIYRVCK